MGAEADIARARKKPIPEEKMRELLLKARKGATASFTFTQFVQMLDKLGWQLEPIPAWTPFHYMYQGEEQLRYEHSAQNPSEALIAAFEAKRERMTGEALNDLPEPSFETVGATVITDVGPVKIGSEGIRLFYYRKWVGTEGVKITSPRGEEAEFIPSHHDYDRGQKSVTDPKSYFASGGTSWRWLAASGIEEDISAALGMEKHVPADQRTRENTGTCAHCWGNYKLEDGRLVLHGYKRPRIGFAVGQCRGVRFQPLEVSDAGAKDALEDLHLVLEQTKRMLDALQSGKVTEIEWGRNKFVRKGDPSFERHLENQIRKTKSDVDQLTAEIELYGKVIAAWHTRPMPKEGELQRGPKFFIK